MSIWSTGRWRAILAHALSGLVGKRRVIQADNEGIKSVTRHRLETSDDIKQVLGLDQLSAARKWGKVAVVALLVLALTAAVGMYLTSGNGATVQFQTAEVQRGDLTVTVTATGTLQPVNQIDVGTEVSGTIETVSVDYNDRVKIGQVLAKLDTDQLEAKLRQSAAALALAQGRVEEAQATFIETRHTLYRSQELARKGMCAQEECDAAEAAYARAEAALAIAKAQVVQAQAQYDADRTVLGKAVIRAPIDGMVLQRQIEPGQTVTASLQTPVLFVLAESLARMELHVDVDEADIGQVDEGQAATFTVAAYADQLFPAVITQVRFAPKTVEGVVTYETVLAVDNTHLRLRPGMTATADITINRLDNVLLVPNAALRFTPPAMEEQDAGGGGGLLGRLLPRRPFHRQSTDRRQDTDSGRSQRVWTQRDSLPVAIPVTVGATDGRMTEVLSGALDVGTAVIIDIRSTDR
jgi:HlyD family secretion protein